MVEMRHFFEKPYASLWAFETVATFFTVAGRADLAGAFVRARVIVFLWCFF
jgi:hypothetical protein